MVIIIYFLTYINIGCRSLLGLEKNTKLMTLCVNENCLRKIEGLENLTMLGNLNIANNSLEYISGL
jgi:hypothetical protein